VDSEYGEAVGCCRQCKYFLEPPVGSALCCLLQDSTEGERESCKFAQKLQTENGFCKMHGEETRFTYDQFKAGKCRGCEHKRKCRFTSYFQCMYGPFNCAGESIAS